MRVFRNKKAGFNYYFVQELEAGIVLKGSEIKSIRAGKVNFKDAYARIEAEEVWLYNLHIGSYEKANVFDHEPERRRKLLLNRKEIRKISTKVDEKGFTLIPKDLYINEEGLVKITLAVAKGKKTYDKRDSLKEKDEERERLRK